MTKNSHIYKILFLTAFAFTGISSSFGAGLTWWEHSNPPHNNYSKELVNEWNVKNPSEKVEYEFFAMTPYLKKLTTALSTRSASDVFTVTDSVLPSFTSKNMLAAINPALLGYKNLDEMKKAYLPNSLDGYIYQGKLYAVPVIATPLSLYINRKHFIEAGLDPDKDYPKSWEDIVKVGNKLVKTEGGKITREAFDFPMHSSTWTMWYFNAMIRQYGGEVLDLSGKKCTVNSEAGIQAMKTRAMYSQEYKISDPTVSLATNALPAEDLPKGRVSMFISHAGSVAQFGPDVMKDVKVVPFPQVNPKKQIAPLYGFALAINPQISEAQTKTAHEFVKFVIKDPKSWYANTAYPYPAANFLDLPGIEDARKNKHLDVFLNDIKVGKYVQRAPQILEINEAIHRAIERVVLKGDTPKSSLDQACKEIDTALAQQ
jgi:multiple sugar transport system substrate-binding protein